MVAKRDRIARDVVLAASIERAVTIAGARLVSASGEGNGDSPADAFIRTVIDGAAQYEHGLIRARTCAALAAKRAHGERVGSLPFGFAVDAGGVRLVINEQEQATICVFASFALAATRFALLGGGLPSKGTSAAPGGSSWRAGLAHARWRAPCRS